MEIPLSEESLPATPRLRQGDVVRVTKANRMQRYQPGDKGMIVMGPKGLGSGQLYYLVMMYKDDPQRIVIFTEDEIEPDR